MTTIEKKWSTIKDNKYWVKALYRQMITEYSKLREGDKTTFGVTITPLFMKKYVRKLFGYNLTQERSNIWRKSQCLLQLPKQKIVYLD